MTPETARLCSRNLYIIFVKVYVRCVRRTNVADLGLKVVQLNSKRLCLDVEPSAFDLIKTATSSVTGSDHLIFLVLFTWPFPQLY
jgi:hypothetical protein